MLPIPIWIFYLTTNFYKFPSLVAWNPLIRGNEMNIFEDEVFLCVLKTNSVNFRELILQLEVDEWLSNYNQW